MSGRLDEFAASRRRAQALSRMRAMARSGAGARPEELRTPSPERCDICGTQVPDDHRHLLHLVERRIVCACEACWALHSGDAQYRPSGMRTVWLDGFDCRDDMWAAFQIPIGLAFFMRSSVSAPNHTVIAFYPSPAGATESELSLEAWDALVAANPVLEELDPDAEALIVNRMADPPQYAIAPIDACYALVGLIKLRWEGISGGDALEHAVPEFFAELRAKATTAPPARRGVRQ